VRPSAAAGFDLSSTRRFQNHEHYLFQDQKGKHYLILAAGKRVG
jgi:hypothetical protein